jgi:hypothetical protein
VLERLVEEAAARLGFDRTGCGARTSSGHGDAVHDGRGPTYDTGAFEAFERAP